MKSHLFVRKYQKKVEPEHTWKEELQSAVYEWIENAQNQTKEATLHFNHWQDQEKLATQIPDGRDRYAGWLRGANIVASYFTFKTSDWAHNLMFAKDSNADQHILALITLITQAKSEETALGAGGFHAAGGALECIRDRLIRIRQEYTCEHSWSSWEWYEEYDTGYCDHERKCRKCNTRQSKMVFIEDVFQRMMKRHGEAITRGGLFWMR